MRPLRWLPAAVLAVLVPGRPARAVDLRPAIQGNDLRVASLRYALSDALPFPRPGERGAVGPFAWVFHAVVGRGRVVLVDAGTEAFLDPIRGPGLRRHWRVVEAAPLADVLARVGLAPDDVTDVVLTHHHWDHADGVRAFPRARVHVHAGEWARFAGRGAVPADRLDLLDTLPARPLPWIELHRRGRHTPFHAAVDVACAEGALHLLGDEPHLPAAGPARPGRGGDRELAGHDPGLFPPGSGGVALWCGPRGAP